MTMWKRIGNNFETLIKWIQKHILKQFLQQILKQLKKQSKPDKFIAWNYYLAVPFLLSTAVTNNAKNNDYTWDFAHSCLDSFDRIKAIVRVLSASC